MWQLLSLCGTGPLSVRPLPCLPCCHPQHSQFSPCPDISSLLYVSICSSASRQKSFAGVGGHLHNAHKRGASTATGEDWGGPLHRTGHKPAAQGDRREEQDIARKGKKAWREKRKAVWFLKHHQKMSVDEWTQQKSSSFPALGSPT